MRSPSCGPRDGSVTVSRPCSSPAKRELDTRPLHRLRWKRLVGREGLEPAVDHRAIGRRDADHRRDHGERHLEVAVHGAGLRADPPVVDVHHAVGTGLQLGEPGQLDVDVEGAGRAAGDDLDRDSRSPRSARASPSAAERRVRGLAPRLPAHDVRAVTRVALEPAEAERRLGDRGTRQRERGFSRGDPGAARSHVDVHEHVDRDAVGRRPRGRDPRR